MEKKCQQCGGDLDWLGRCELERLARPRMPTALILLAVLVLLAGCVTTEVTRTIHIQPRPLVEALTRWAELTGYQIIVPSDPATEAISRSVSGSDAQTALDDLLDGTGLTHRWVNARTVAIRCRE